MIKVTEVRTKKEWKEFALFPIELYKDCPYYVPTFVVDDVNMANPKKNAPAMNAEVKAFLAYKNGVVAGRIAAIIARESNELFGQKRIRFTRFDAIDDIDVTSSLIAAVEDFGRQRGMCEIHGPWGFNDTDREGMLTSGFDLMGSYATYYNFPYYSEHMRALGFVDESVWVESRVVFPKEGEPNYERFCKLGEYTKRKFGLTELCDTLSVPQIVKRYGDKFFDCFNAAYKDLDMFVEIKGKVKQTVLDQFAVMINKDYLSVLVDSEDNVVAFCVAIPSFGKLMKKHGGRMTLPFLIELGKCLKKPDTIELTLIAVRPEFKKRGYTAGCIARIMKGCSDNNVENVVSMPTLKDNVSVRSQWSALENEIIKTRQTFIKEIQ